MKAITEYAKSHSNNGENVTVEIQTNGVFTNDIREWVLINANIVWMSFDGMKDIQNYNRPLNPKYSHIFNEKTSADVLEENVKWLIKNKVNKKLMIGARVTINDSNIEKQKEMVDYFYNLGIRYVWTNPLFYSVEKIPVCNDTEKKNNFNFDMDSYINNYLEAYEYGREKGLFWGSFLAVNFDGESPYHCRCCIPKEAPHITPDGYISACDMVVLGGEAHHMNSFIVGKWNNDNKEFEFYEDKIKILNERKSTNMVHCKNCSVKLHCGGYCLGETVNETGILNGQNIAKCVAIRKLFSVLGECQPYPYLHP